jgi:predicted negative regulator of RcsB-dependent stress response
MKQIPHRRVLVLVSFFIFAVSSLLGMTYWHQQSEQWRTYMLGRMAYTTTLYDLSTEYFDKSYAAYQDELQSGRSFTAAPPSLELAELGQHFKALSLAKEGTQDSSKLAVITFKEALKLTTEEALSHVQLRQDMLSKLCRDRLLTQIDFEILFHQKPEMAKGEGKGKGKPQDGDKQSENPGGNAAGKTDRDQL